MGVSAVLLWRIVYNLIGVCRYIINYHLALYFITRSILWLRSNWDQRRQSMHMQFGCIQPHECMQCVPTRNMVYVRLLVTFWPTFQAIDMFVQLQFMVN